VLTGTLDGRHAKRPRKTGSAGREGGGSVSKNRLRGGGCRGGRKLDKARELGVTVIDEQELLQLLAKPCMMNKHKPLVHPRHIAILRLCHENNRLITDPIRPNLWHRNGKVLTRLIACWERGREEFEDTTLHNKHVMDNL
jgi:hypothetical protein